VHDASLKLLLGTLGSDTSLAVEKVAPTPSCRRTSSSRRIAALSLGLMLPMVLAVMQT